MRTSKGLVAVDVLRHVLALCIIVQHMHSSTRYDDVTNARIGSLVTVAQGAVLIFFLLSGFFFHTTQEKSRRATLSALARSRGRRLLIPFLAFSLLNAVLLGAMKKITAASALHSMLMLHGVGMQLYFLPYLFLITLLVASVCSLRKDSPHGELSVCAAMAVPAALLALYLPTASATGDDYRLLPLYLLAFLLGKIISSVDECSAKRFAFGIKCGLPLVCLALGAVDFRFYFLGAGTLALEGAMRLSRVLPECRLPGSGAVYMLHTPVLNFAISTLLVKLGIVAWPNVLTTIAVTYAACLLILCLFLKTLPRYRWLLLE